LGARRPTKGEQVEPMQQGGGEDAGRAGGSGSERETLNEFLAEVQKARKQLDPASAWQPTLEVLEEELEDGQPLFLKCNFAASSKSNSETPVASE
jgi:hypothetical protein